MLPLWYLYYGYKEYLRPLFVKKQDPAEGQGGNVEPAKSEPPELPKPTEPPKPTSVLRPEPIKPPTRPAIPESPKPTTPVKPEPPKPSTPTQPEPSKATTPTSPFRPEPPKPSVALSRPAEPSLRPEPPKPEPPQTADSSAPWRKQRYEPNVIEGPEIPAWRAGVTPPQPKLAAPTPADMNRSPSPYTEEDIISGIEEDEDIIDEEEETEDEEEEE